MKRLVLYSLGLALAFFAPLSPVQATVVDSWNMSAVFQFQNTAFLGNGTPIDRTSFGNNEIVWAAYEYGQASHEIYLRGNSGGQLTTGSSVSVAEIFSIPNDYHYNTHSRLETEVGATLTITPGISPDTNIQVELALPVNVWAYSYEPDPEALPGWQVGFLDFYTDTASFVQQFVYEGMVYEAVLSFTSGWLLDSDDPYNATGYNRAKGLFGYADGSDIYMVGSHNSVDAQEIWYNQSIEIELTINHIGPVSAVPIPGALFLLAPGLAGLGYLRKRMS